MIDSVEEFIRLIGSSDYRDRRRAVLEEAPEVVWLHIIEHFPDERVGVALNKKLPESVLEKLVSVGDRRVRSLVVTKRKLGADLLDVLSRDEDESVRLEVARHRNTSTATLEMLREDPWDEVRSTASLRLSDIT